MPRQFTDAQRQAIDSNARDICVSAGAGSGKTGVLVERFMRIVTDSLAGQLPLSERAVVSEILVVTFTDRATKEMKSRIVDALNARGLVEERRQLEAAYISTIHGLCSRLLKENPFEAEVDPGFTVLGEAASRLMIRSAFDEVIADGYRAQDADIIELVADVLEDPTFTGSDLDGLPMLAFEAEAVMRKLRSAGTTLDALQQSLNSEGSRDADADPVLTLLNPTFRDLTACIDDLRSMAAGAGGAVHRAAASILEAVGRMRLEADVVTRVANVQSMGAAAAKAGMLVGLAPSNAALLALLDRIKAACDRVSDLFGVSADREAMSKRKCNRFMALICKIWESYAAAKRRSGLLDNDDLVLQCVRLLDESAHIRHRCRRQFRHLMIDEFQDTDLLQARLLGLLHTGKIALSRLDHIRNSDTDVTQNSRFIVGDVQQSIYGFRSADPEIFRSLDRRFREDGAGLHIQLSDNFRSRPEILQLVQQVFGIAWHAESTPFVALRSAARFDDKPKPSVELLITMNLARREYVHTEAETIASRIKAIVENADEYIKITAQDNERNGIPAGYGDITVLLRGLTDVRIYEEAFARNGVPALVTAGGRGYYARYEIQDLLSVLTLLDSPLDEVALLTALRSPFVGAEVDTLYRLAVIARAIGNGTRVGRERGPLYSALRELLTSPELPAAERDKIEPFLSAIERLRGDVDRVPVGQLMDRLIVETNYDMRLVCRPGGRRKLANVRKLVQIALAEPGLSVYEFVRRMRDIQVLSDREGDAATAEEGAGVVRLMTIHSAKGLEFPIVVLPDLSRGLVSPETAQFVCDPASGAIGARTGGEPDAAYRAIVKRRQEAERSEYLRMLYVAMTRAQEHLILCGNVGRNRGYNWADVVFPALGITSAPASAERTMLNGGVEARVAPFSTLLAVSERDKSSVTIGANDQAADLLVERLLAIKPPDHLNG